MTAKATIISEINTTIGSLYTAYRIGITHDPVERKGIGQAKKAPLTGNSGGPIPWPTRKQSKPTSFSKKG
jgi:hypothetical protein